MLGKVSIYTKAWWRGNAMDKYFQRLNDGLRRLKRERNRKSEVNNGKPRRTGKRD